MNAIKIQKRKFEFNCFFCRTIEGIQCGKLSVSFMIHLRNVFISKRIAKKFKNIPPKERARSLKIFNRKKLLLKVEKLLLSVSRFKKVLKQKKKFLKKPKKNKKIEFKCN